MPRWFLFALAVWAALPRCEAQIDLLTLAESEEILERLPLFKSSEGRGECPGFVILDHGTSQGFSLQVKGFCPPDGFAGSTTIGNFVVDRSSGTVTVWGSGHSVGEPPEMKSLARALVAQAKARVLSEREAECIARQAARAESSPGEPLSVTRTSRGAGREVQFLIQYPLVTPRAAAVWNLSVDTSSLAVLESPNGPTFHSLEVDELLSRMRAVRLSPSLSVAETIEVAVRVPSISARVSARCSALLSADFGTANRRFVAVEDACEDYPRVVPIIGAVDVLTGAVTEPRSQKALDTPESKRLAQDLLRRARERQAAARAEIQAVCR